MSNSIPSDQLKYRNYRALPILTALALAFIYSLVILGAVWSRSTLSDLILPIGALVFLGVFSVSMVAVGTSIQARRERQGIETLFAEPAWATWQYTPEEWQSEYEQRYRGEKLRARASCSNLLVGPVLGAIFFLVGFFTRNSPYSTFLVFIGVVVGLGIMLLGIIQFYRGRAEAQQHYLEAQQLPSPLLIFGRQGLYHQGIGYTSLRRLHRAEILSPNSGNRFTQAIYAYVNKMYQGRNQSYLRLHVWAGRRRSPVHTIPIPQRYEANAEQLVERYTSAIKERGFRGW